MRGGGGRCGKLEGQIRQAKTMKVEVLCAHPPGWKGEGGGYGGTLPLKCAGSGFNLRARRVFLNKKLRLTSKDHT